MALLTQAQPVYGRLATWRLSSAELGVSVRAPQELRQLAVDLGTDSYTVGAAQDAEKSAQRIASNPRSVRVTAEWRADDSSQDIRPHKRDLEKLHNHDPDLGRPPRVTFEWGSVERLTGIITSMEITWVDGLFATPPYYPRAFVVDFMVQRQLSRQFEFGTRFARETTNRTVGDGEDFEDLAWDRYGDPYLGILLRRTNPGVSQFGLQRGDTVRLLDADHPDMLESVEPTSPALLGDVEGILQSMAEERLALSGAVGVDAIWDDLGL
jgi:hypothetical protein